MRKQDDRHCPSEAQSGGTTVQAGSNSKLDQRVSKMDVLEVSVRVKVLVLLQPAGASETKTGSLKP